MQTTFVHFALLCFFGLQTVSAGLLGRAAPLCIVKYETRWPHCTNLGQCFKNAPRSHIIKLCAKSPKCDGFSYTAGNPKNGSGCLKQKCRPDNVNGYGQKSHMYFQCKVVRPGPNPCKVKYTKRWPHCTNIGQCFTNAPRSHVMKQCAKNPKCDGFSYTAGNPLKGSGCLKQRCRPDNVKGYGQKSHMYFQCKPEKPKPSPCKVKYTKRWPHCTNIGECFKNAARSHVIKQCAKNPKCDGFSYTAGNPLKGSGCLKQNCRPDNVKGYGQKSHMYFQCKPEKPKPSPCKVKYTKRWPHCTNIGECFKNAARSHVIKQCTKNPKCDGFSYTAGNPLKGSGCLKQNCRPDNVKGYGQKSHMYFQCKPEKPKPGPCKVKYTKRWPHCTNIGECFKNAPRSHVIKQCAKNPKCDGFSYTAGNPVKGSGCLKQNCRPDNVKGYGQKSHMYFQCKPEKPKPSRACTIKYKNKWPHCTNIKCFKPSSRIDLLRECTKNPKCDGFSYTVGNSIKGSGCFKQNCKPDNVKGYGQKTHMYYECGKAKYVNPKPEPKPQSYLVVAGGFFALVAVVFGLKKWRTYAAMDEIKYSAL